MQIREARAGELHAVRALFQEYADSLGVDLGFQDFDRELAELPGDYVRPRRGRLFLALDAAEAVACGALRAIDDRTAELKRLYVRPSHRGLGVGRRLTNQLIAAARAEGYDAIRLDTLPSMREAHRLYEQLGFREIAPYRPNPVEGTSFLELKLVPSLD